MFAYTGSDAAQLQNEYHFGNLESAANRPDVGEQPARTNAEGLTSLVFADDPTEPEDVHVANVQRMEDYSPQEAPDPPTPWAFGPREDGPALGRGGLTTTAAAPVADNKTKKDVSKKHVAKEILGMNKPNMKGKSDEEKERIKLEQRWKNAQAESERLDAMEQRVTSGEIRTEAIGKVPNLPPNFLCIHPLVYHSISAEVPPARQHVVKVAFWNWVAVCILLVVNCGVAIGVGFAPYIDAAHKERYKFNKALNTVLAAVYLIGIPLSFITWYWRIYRACSTGRPSEHLVTLFGLIIALAWAFFAFIGVRNYGTCGIQLAIHIGQSRKRGVVAPVIVVLVLWIAEAGVACYLIVKEWIFYRQDVVARRAAKNAMRNANVIAGV